MGRNKPGAEVVERNVMVTELSGDEVEVVVRDAHRGAFPTQIISMTHEDAADLLVALTRALRGDTDRERATEVRLSAGEGEI
jgi:hypothetical protein